MEGDFINMQIPYWNHNTAYYPVIRECVRACRTVLDVGCGDGTLVRFLDDGTHELTGIDCDAPCIAAADKGPHSGHIRYLCTGFESFAPTEHYDAVVFAASIHHMELEPALEKAKALLNPGGCLCIVGIADPSTMTDKLIEILRVMPSAVISKIRHIHTCEDSSIPVSYHFNPMNEIRAAKNHLLPGAHLRLGLHYRYILTWQKPENEQTEG